MKLPMLPVDNIGELFARIVWISSLLLCASAIVTLIFVVMWRQVRQFYVAKAVKHHKEFSKYFYAFLSSPVEATSASFPILNRRDKQLICKIALDILRTVRGKDAEQIIKLLEIWDMQPYLTRLLRKGSREDQIQALTLFSHFRDAESLKTLLCHAASSDVYVQLAALRGLSARGGIAYIDQIVKYLIKSGKSNRYMLADALALFGEAAIEAIGTLAYSAKATKNVRLAALMALGKIASPTAISILEQASFEDDADFKAVATAALTKIKCIQRESSENLQVEDIKSDKFVASLLVEKRI